MLRPLDAHHGSQPGQELGWRLQLTGAGSGAGGLPHEPRVCPGQPLHHRRVGAERDHVAGRQHALVLRHRCVLVDHPASLQQHVADDGAVLDPDHEHDGAHPVRHLEREAAQHRGLPVAELVVDRRPAVTKRGDDATARAAGQTRDEPLHRPHDRVDIVRLHMDRAEGRLRLVGRKPRDQLRQGHEEVARLLQKAEPLVDCPGLQVRRQHLEGHGLGAALGAPGRDLGHERFRQPLPASSRPHVDGVEEANASVTDLGAVFDLRQRVAGLAVVVLGEQHEARAGHLADVADVAIPRDLAAVQHLRNLPLELLPEHAQLGNLSLREPADPHAARERAISWKSSNGSNGTPRSAR